MECEGHREPEGGAWSWLCVPKGGRDVTGEEPRAQARMWVAKRQEDAPSRGNSGLMCPPWIRNSFKEKPLKPALENKTWPIVDHAMIHDIFMF